MAKGRTVTQEDFGLLLNWLDPEDEAQAARKYEAVRQRLIRIFSGRGCYESEILVDITFDRVALKVPLLIDNFVGDPATYFYGVASNVHHEWLRQQKRMRDASIPIMVIDDEVDREADYHCLEKCIGKLARNLREMIIDYYRDEKRIRIERRKQMAQEMGITMGALQIKTSRIRASLRLCVIECRAEN